MHKYEGKKGTYFLINKLGSGTVGKIFLVKNDERKNFTLKKFDDEDYFENELKKVKALYKGKGIKKSPYVNEMIDYAKIPEDKLFIVYKYFFLEATKIFIVNQQNLNLLLMLMHDILLGLQWIHNRGFAHNDLKPSNFLYDREENIFAISDFDTICSNKIPCRFITTTAFASPDTLFNWGNEGTLEQMQKADLWSVGASFFNLFFITKEPEGRINYFPYPEEIYDEVKSFRTTSDPYKIPISQKQVEKVVSDGSEEEDIIAFVVNGFLKVNPEERLTIQEALEPIHKYYVEKFKEEDKNYTDIYG